MIITDTRNYSTHGDSRRGLYPNLIEDSHGLFIQINKMELIVIFIFLARFIELDESRVSEALSKKARTKTKRI